MFLDLVNQNLPNDFSDNHTKLISVKNYDLISDLRKSFLLDMLIRFER